MAEAYVYLGQIQLKQHRPKEARRQSAPCRGLESILRRISHELRDCSGDEWRLHRRRSQFEAALALIRATRSPRSKCSAAAHPCRRARLPRQNRGNSDTAAPLPDSVSPCVEILISGGKNEAASRQAHWDEDQPGTPRNRTGDFRLQLVRGGSISDYQTTRRMGKVVTERPTLRPGTTEQQYSHQPGPPA